MKRLTLALLVVAALAAGATHAFAAGHSPKAVTVRIVMHDPGCHWFLVGGRFTKTTSTAGPVRLANVDEATLRAASRTGVRLIPVGKSIVLGAGRYVITMVGQAPDDNHLKLTVT